MIPHIPFYRRTRQQDVLTALVEDMESYYGALSGDEQEKLKNLLSFLSTKFPKKWHQRLYIAGILMKTQPDLDTLLAALCIPLDESKISDEDIQKYAGKNAFSLLEGLEKLSAIRFQGEKNAEVVRHFLLSQVEDVRILYLRISKRIGLLQKIHHGDLKLPAKKVERYIKGALHISVPILAQLGIYKLKTLLEDVCFGILYPDEYISLQLKIQKSKVHREHILKEVIAEISGIFQKKQLSYLSIKGRNKGIASIAEKIKRKDYTSYDEVLDLVAIRIIVETPQQCYAVLSELHSDFEHLEDRFKDYISSPKINGYKSLHTSLLGLSPDNMPVEIQIRTQEMDHHAEMGSASHWVYKGGKKVHLSPQNPENSQHVDKFQMMKNTLQQKKKIYPITPTGEIKELPEGATPVDFAYSIHSHVGDKCSGALVNEKIVPLNSVLQTGDMVDILTSPQKKPNPEWLSFVASDSARHKIQNYLNTHSGGHVVSARQREQEKKEQEEKEKFAQEKIAKTRVPYPVSAKKKSPEISPQVLIGGEPEMVHHFAQCCCPKEKKEIVAYSSSSRDFVIHSRYCQNVKNLDPNRLVEAHWDATDI